MVEARAIFFGSHLPGSGRVLDPAHYVVLAIFLVAMWLLPLWSPLMVLVLFQGICVAINGRRWIMRTPDGEIVP